MVDVLFGNFTDGNDNIVRSLADAEQKREQRSGNE
jgi:hypothetical protein